MSPLLKQGIYVIFFQIQWWLCVLSGIEHHEQYAYWIAFILFLLNLFYQPITRPMILFFLILFGCGVANDTLLIQLGVFKVSFQGYLIPVWLIVLWACFSTWFLHAQWLNQRLIVIVCLFSIGGTGSYYFADRVHALTFLMPLNQSLMMMALDWFCLGLLFFLIARCLGRDV